ncbi:MAG: biotin/lipoyl-binding protein, partial [Aestuariivirga sp.]
MQPINTNSSLRRFQIVGFLSVLIMVGVVGGWANFTELNGAVIAPATIMVESYSKKVQHKEGGIVGEIRVKDGDRVEIGQTLVVLDNTETKSELTIIDGLLDEALAKRARLEAQRDRASALIFPPEVLARASEPGVAAIMAGQTKLFDARLQAVVGKKDQLTQQIGQLTEQIGGLESQKISKEKQLTLISAELTDLKDLQSKGLVPISRVMAMDRETARLEGERGELVASKASAEARIA